jgi:photosystem II stability/assembly factor-like uncharacterized protein
MQRPPSLLALFFITLVPASAQWQLQTSNTTADLRGIHSIGNGVAWASGANGTVLRTFDDGKNWLHCPTPPGAERLDFRAIQAFDSSTAIVMSSGRGDQSRLYKTDDGCLSWTLIFTNPDPDGFWDAFVLNRSARDGELLGGPVNGKFVYWETADRGNTWHRVNSGGLEALTGEGAFAVSNSALFLNDKFGTAFVTGGSSGPRILTNDGSIPTQPFISHPLPLASGSISTGALSVVARDECCWVVVGGNYNKPYDTGGTAAYSNDGGKSWHAALAPPHGFRTSVAWDGATQTWVTVGPNGTDISTDDGKNWRPLRPNLAHDAPVDADKNWNAISLPFVVGQKGRIGRHSRATEVHANPH